MDHPGFNFFRSTLARQTFLLFVVSAVLPVAFVAILSFGQVSSQLHELSYEQSRQAGKAIAMELLRHLLLLGDDLGGVAEILRNDPQRASDQQSPALPAAHLAAFAAVSLLVDGEAPLFLRGKLDYIPRLSGPEKAHLAAGRSLLRLSPRDQGTADILLMRLLDPGKPADGVLIGRLSDTELRTLENLLPTAAGLHLFGPGNRLLYASAGVNRAVPASLQQQVSKAISGHCKWHSADVNYLASYWSLFTRAEFMLPHLVVVVSQTETAALAPIADFQTLYFPGLLLMVLLVSLVAVNRIRNKLAPVIALRDATRRVAGGDFSDRIEISSDDELAELGRAFNSMTGKLGTQFNSIATMAEIDRLILSSFDTRYIITTLLVRAGELTPCSLAAVVELDESGNETATLSLRANIAGAETTEHEVRVTGEELMRLEHSPDGIVIACDENRPPCLAGLPPEKACQFLMLPTFVKRKPAAIIVFAYDAAHTVTGEECEQLRKLADHVAVALSNARWEERLYHQAHYDTLTNLPNRALLKDRLEQAIARAQRNAECVGVMFIDLDRFKLVNDSLGHGAGDLLLQNIAALLQRCVRNVDTVVRFGGDEFVVIIPDIHQHEDVIGQLGIIAGKILESAGKEMTLGDHTVHVDTSIGIALYPKDAQTADELVKHADNAMYHAKEQGRGCYRFFAPELNITATHRLNTEQELRRALQNDEFRVHYQPKYDCASGALCGAEALIRWQHPQKGLIAPDQFISLAEESGQIQHIGAWVLRRACEQIKSWRDAGLPALRVAVNLSPRQFRDADISAMVAQTLGASGLDAAALELEVTEGSVMENTADSIDKLRRLHSMGVRIFVDDFGTGYSSLNYLRTLPIDALKIDRTFIMQMLEDERAGAIVATIIALAHNLGLQVVAEGVETEQQKRRLQELHCDVCQGYLYSSPLSPDKFAVMLEEHRRTDATRGRVDTGKHCAK